MKKAVGQMKNGLAGPGQDKDTLTAVQRVSEWHPVELKRDDVSTLLSFVRIDLREDSVAACVVGSVRHKTQGRNNQTISIMTV